MHHSYDDIRSRISADPTWFDEHAVPRYEPFSPDACANIYARQAILLRIACQNCQREFDVAMTSDSWRLVDHSDDLWTQIQKKLLHYGDPPNVHCCGAGATMNCIDLRVLQAWEKPPFEAWTRRPEYEVQLEEV